MLILILIFILIALLLFNRESFNIPVGKSSAWDWNTGPGYGAGYGTGYGKYRVWPETDPFRPWQYWMWGRRPNVFKNYYTPVPQIDY